MLAPKRDRAAVRAAAKGPRPVSVAAGEKRGLRLNRDAPLYGDGDKTPFRTAATDGRRRLQAIGDYGAAPLLVSMRRAVTPSRLTARPSPVLLKGCTTLEGTSAGQEGYWWHVELRGKTSRLSGPKGTRRPLSPRCADYISLLLFFSLEHTIKKQKAEDAL